MKHRTIYEHARMQGCTDTIYGWTEDQYALAAGVMADEFLPAKDLAGLKRVKDIWQTNYFSKVPASIYNFAWAQAAFTNGLAQIYSLNVRINQEHARAPPARIRYFERMNGR